MATRGTGAIPLGLFVVERDGSESFAMLPFALSVSPRSSVTRCIVRSIFSDSSEALRASVSAPRGGWTKFALRSRLVLDPNRSDRNAVRLALGSLCRNHHLLLFFFGFASSPFKLHALHGCGRYAAVRRPLRSPTDRAKAPPASSPRPPPPASWRSSCRERLSFPRGASGPSRSRRVRGCRGCRLPGAYA